MFGIHKPLIQKALTVLLLIFCFLTAQNQPLKKETYYRIRLQDPHDPDLVCPNPKTFKGYCTCGDGLQQLEEHGLTLDHGEWRKGRYFITEINGEELDELKKLDVPFDILVRDLTRYYERRANEKKNAKDIGSEVMSSINGIAGEITPCILPGLPTVEYGSMGGYYNYAELLTKLDQLRSNFPSLISIKRPISTNLLTEERRTVYYVRISNNPDAEQNRPRILYNALHHAREPLSMMQLIYFMRYLLEQYGHDALVTDLLDHTELYFIPCLNPDGYVYNQTQNPYGGGLWRKNRKNNNDGNYGVDINRNYGYQWGYDNFGSSTRSSSETYRGTSAFSEAETQMMREFMNRFRFNLSINHHSYGNAVVEPFSYMAGTLPPEDSATIRQNGQLLSQCNGFVPGTLDKVLGYTANGVAIDWMYMERSTKPKTFAFTVETGNSTDGFWPSIDRIGPLCVGNIALNLQAALFARNSNPLSSKASSMYNAHEITDKSRSAFYPNPAASSTTLLIPEAVSNSRQPATIEVLDIVGKKVMQAMIAPGQRQATLSTANLRPGVYLCRIAWKGNHTELRKLVIAN